MATRNGYFRFRLARISDSDASCIGTVKKTLFPDEEKQRR